MIDEHMASLPPIADLFPGVKPREGNDDGDERYTIRETDAWCRNVARVEAWDLDVAACDESHLAPKYYEKSDNGLLKPWFGRVYCNPPFSDIEPWVVKAWGEMAHCLVIAMLLPANRTEQKWWQDHVEEDRDGKSHRPWDRVALSTHFLPRRTRFGHPGNREGDGVDSPPFGCVCLVWRRVQ